MSSRATGVTSLRKNGNCGTNYRRILIRTGLCKKPPSFIASTGYSIPRMVPILEAYSQLL